MARCATQDRRASPIELTVFARRGASRAWDVRCFAGRIRAPAARSLGACQIITRLILSLLKVPHADRCRSRIPVAALRRRAPDADPRGPARAHPRNDARPMGDPGASRAPARTLAERAC